MRSMFDAFWRSVAYCLHPRVIALSFLPLVLMVVLSFALGYFFWDTAVSAVAAWFEAFDLVQAFLSWLERMGLASLRAVFAPMVVLVLATPVIVLVCLLLVALFMTPAMVDLVGQRRFARLDKRHGGSWVLGLFWSLGSTLVAVLALLLSMPLWLVPPLVLILPPLIWGWLTYRVFAFDALATHASADERRQLMREHRSVLLVMGVLSGYLGAAPSLLWASGAMFIALAPLLVPVAIWIYTLVFAFASLWFAHYLLAALERLRATAAVEVVDPAPATPVSEASVTPPNGLPPADPLPLPPGPHQP
ncbi:MAG: EI24 domain-containing protein [Hydrogenophaga sp.]|uniref:EI24 domain-containing protein n=1 Tax=Hydrogenophaga crocea TaxID=2716225 RepID=A0A6G8IE45_9BURK|nr:MULTISPECIES: EI24 domain-containing protein [Hydrogenophaga]MBL0943531.1 EI24 domain-containing protein [Hydrogenophaga sp.]QIM51348.1 EI24 domain-containing protein [Hydrogenophaga crocea]